MNKQFCLIILLLTSRVCTSQNLVPNGDFEQYSGCPAFISDFDSLLNWFNPCLPPYGVTGTLSGSPDYFNACSGVWVGIPSNNYGYQYAHSGSGYAGLIPFSFSMNFREYIEVPLASSLIANTDYYFEMYVSVSNRSSMAIDTIAIYFSDTAIANLHSHQPLQYNPQIKIAGFITDTLNWVAVSGTFTATGGENYLIIGNFNDDLNTNMITLNGDNLFCHLYIDDVSLTAIMSIEEESQRPGIKIYPNPISDNLHIVVDNNELFEILIYDFYSREIIRKQFYKFTTLNTEQLAKGFYLYEVRSKDGFCHKGKVVKD
jgi:hypothetical protein